MIKILFLIPSLTEGGAEKVLRNLVNNMDQSKFEITVQTFQKQNAELYLKSGIKYRSINNCKSKIGQKLFDYWFRLCAELKLAYPLYVKGDYDVEVAYLECGATKVLASSTNKKALKLAWVHCDLKLKEGFSESLERSMQYYKKYDKVVCVSNGVKNSFDCLFGGAIESTVLYNINDEEEIFEKATSYLETKNTTRIVSIGRLTHQKGFDRLIEVCGMLKKDGYLFEMLILGEGTERPNLEKMVEIHGVKDRVRLMGFVDNPYPYIKSADIVVCSSRCEGLSTVVIESIMLGKPVVTTPCSGMKEILGESEFGLVTSDSIEGIYNGIKELLDCEEKRNQLSIAAKKRGKDFAKKETIDEIETFICCELSKKVSNRG